MTLQIIYSTFSGQILQWQDTEQLHHAEPPDAVLIKEVTKAEWANQQSLKWVMDGQVTDTEPTIVPPALTEKETRLINLAIRDSLLVEASATIAPLQDADDLDEATPDEKSALIAWKRYRVALSRIEQQSGFPMSIDWPPVPRPVGRPSPKI